MGLFTSNRLVFFHKHISIRCIFTEYFIFPPFANPTPPPLIRRRNQFFLISEGADYSCATFLYSIRKEKTNSKNLRDLFIDQKMRFFKVTALEGRIIILRVLSFSVFKL